MKKTKQNDIPTFAKIFLIITALVIYFFVRKPFQTTPPVVVENEPTQTISLPQNWQADDISDSSIKITLPSPDSTYIPTIIYKKNTLPDTDITPATFVDNQIKGARSAISRLSYSQNQTDPHDSLYIRLLIGSYYDKQQKISLIQRIYLDTTLSQIHTLTASYVESVNGNLTTDINTIFDTLSSQYILGADSQN